MSFNFSVYEIEIRMFFILLGSYEDLIYINIFIV